jgi:hypothetical protein
MEINPPKKRDPESPKNILLFFLKLKYKKENSAEITIIVKPNNSELYFEKSSKKLKKTIITVPARPSSPSIKLIELIIEHIIKIVIT